jgi:hypothetical protein
MTTTTANTNDWPPGLPDRRGRHELGRYATPRTPQRLQKACG